MLDGAEARLIGSPGLGRDELVRLRGARVAVIGAGMLGGQLVQHLAMLGVGQVIVDCGRVDVANLGNQGFGVASLGVPKSVARARQVAALNPDCHVRALSCRIEDLGLAALAGVDLIATGLDSRAARMRVNEISWALGTRWVDAGVDGSGRWLHGTITMYDPRRDDSPCYVCRLDAAGVAAIAKEGRPHACPSWRRVAAPVTTPTLQASAFGAIVGGFQALQVTSALLQPGCDPAGRQLVVECDGVPRVRRLELARNPRCLFDHAPVPLRSCPGVRLADLLGAATADLGAPPEEICCRGRAFVTGLVCARCGATRDLVRVTEACTDDDVRCGCGAAGEMAPVATGERLTGGEAARQAQRTWHDLGISAGEVVSATVASQVRHYIVNQLPEFSLWEATEARMGGSQRE